MDPSRTPPRQSPRIGVQTPPRSPNVGASRLSTIMESKPDAAAAAAGKKQNRRSAGSAFSKKSSPPRHSSEPMPPPYARYAFQQHGIHTVDEEKQGSKKILSRRGGWGRLCIIILIVILILAVALGVGLGVELSKHKKSTGTSSASPAADSSSVAAFPIGEYSMITSLANVSTDCTSNAATWSCWPYNTYSATNPSLSEATFNWVLSNTTSTYPTNGSMLTTGSAGVPANITISPADNPFTITFANQSLTYINNDTNPRYTFSFTQSKSVIPSSAITSDGSQTTCFYNSTIFSATLHLSSTLAQDYNSSATGSSAYTAWPYAIEIEQVSPGGQGTPDCYETVNGVVGQRITTVTAESTSDMCVCDYKNFGL